MGLDLLTFALVYGSGDYWEANPVMAAGLARYGLVVVALLKIALTVAISLLVLRANRYTELRWWTAAFGAAFGMLGTFGNVKAWLRL
jgi:hypothetical protein